MTTTFQTGTVESAAEAYVRSRVKARFLSIAPAIRAIRTLFPACRATDRKLEDGFGMCPPQHSRRFRRIDCRSF